MIDAPRASTVTGRCSPFDERFDLFWARLNDPVSPWCCTPATGASNGYAEGFASPTPAGRRSPRHRAGHQGVDGVAHPRTTWPAPSRIAPVENGAQFARPVRRALAGCAGLFRGRPVDIFREHVWINPFWEDDVYEVVEHMGADRVVFGSDWPHIEALPEPLDYLRELKDFDADQRRRILYDNVVELSTPRPA
jgi:hypothetical protein